MNISDILLIAGLIGAAAGLFICFKPKPKKRQETVIPVPVPKVIEAENVAAIDEEDSDRNPANAVGLSEEEIRMIESEDGLEEMIASATEEDLKSLGYSFPKNAQEEKKENAVSVAEEDGRTYFPAPEQEMSEPEYFRH